MRCPNFLQSNEVVGAERVRQLIRRSEWLYRCWWVLVITGSVVTLSSDKEVATDIGVVLCALAIFTRWQAGIQSTQALLASVYSEGNNTNTPLYLRSRIGFLEARRVLSVLAKKLKQVARLLSYLCVTAMKNLKLHCKRCYRCNCLCYVFIGMVSYTVFHQLMTGVTTGRLPGFGHQIVDVLLVLLGSLVMAWLMWLSNYCCCRRRLSEYCSSDSCAESLGSSVLMLLILWLVYILVMPISFFLTAVSCSPYGDNLDTDYYVASIVGGIELATFPCFFLYKCLMSCGHDLKQYLRQLSDVRRPDFSNRVGVQVANKNSCRLIFAQYSSHLTYISAILLTWAVGIKNHPALVAVIAATGEILRRYLNSRLDNKSKLLSRIKIPSRAGREEMKTGAAAPTMPGSLMIPTALSRLHEGRGRYHAVAKTSDEPDADLGDTKVSAAGV